MVHNELAQLMVTFINLTHVSFKYKASKRLSLSLSGWLAALSTKFGCRLWYLYVAFKVGFDGLMIFQK